MPTREEIARAVAESVKNYLLSELFLESEQYLESFLNAFNTNIENLPEENIEDALRAKKNSYRVLVKSVYDSILEKTVYSTVYELLGYGIGGGSFTSLSDTPNSYEGHAGKFVRVKVEEDGLEFVTLTGGGGSGVSSFLDLLDTPSSYSGSADYLVSVNSSATALVFVDKAPDSDKLDGYHASDFAPASHTHLKAHITDFSHTHLKSEITDFSHTHLKSEITDFAHQHSASDITSGRLSLSRLPTSSTVNTFLVIRTAGSDPIWGTLTADDLPSHTHTRSDIVDFSHNHDDLYYTKSAVNTLLEGKADINHSHSFLDLSDTPSSYSGQGGKYLRVSVDGTGIEFADVQGGGGGATTFLDLTDTPSSYSGSANSVVLVNNLENGLIFSATLPTSALPTSGTWSLTSNFSVQTNNKISIKTPSGSTLVDLDLAQQGVSIGKTYDDSTYKLDIGGYVRAVSNTYLATDSGHVGIGTTTISNAGNWNKVLDVSGSTHSTVLIRSSLVNTRIFAHNTGAYGISGVVGGIGTEGTVPFIIFTNATSRVYVSSSGVYISSSATREATERLEVDGKVKADSFISTVLTGTAPLQVTSSTVVTNLNADFVDGKHASDFAPIGHTHPGSDITSPVEGATVAETLAGYSPSMNPSPQKVVVSTNDGTIDAGWLPSLYRKIYIGSSEPAEAEEGDLWIQLS